jgi:hypothetical protein
MKNDLIIIAIVAAATMGLTLAIFWPSSVGAGAAAPAIEKPALTVQGAKVTIEFAEGKFKSGDAARLQLKAVNLTDKPVAATVTVTLTSTRPADMLSRAMPRPKTIWTGQVPLTLRPGETLACPIDTDACLAAGLTSVIAQFEKASVTTGSVVIPGAPTTQPAK